MKYKNLFFDLDDTLWAFSANARDTFEEMYDKYGLGAFFDSFEHFYSLYQQRNTELWIEYGNGRITKEELNRQRFLYPLEAVGAGDSALAVAYSEGFFSVIPTKSRLMPHAKEVLEYLVSRYFKKVILSDDIGLLKPAPQLFYFALSATQSELRDSLMIGDSWEADMVGANGVGMHHAFYNVSGRTEFPFKPTYLLKDLKELMQIL